MKLYYGFFLTFLAFFSHGTLQGAFQQAYQPTINNQIPAQQIIQQPYMQQPQANQFMQQQAMQQQVQQQMQQMQQPAQTLVQQTPQTNHYQQRQTLFHAPQAMLKGAIRVNNDHRKIPEFRIYYDGKQTTNNNEGFFSIPVDDGGSSEYSLLISKGLKQNFEKTNTVKNLVLFTDQDHKFYSLKKTETQNLSWEEKNVGDQKNFVLPPKTLVIILDPQLIERLESWNVGVPNNAITLPRIVLKADAKAAIKDASARSLLGGTMNLGSFHEPVRHKVKHFTKGSCSLAQ